MSVVISGAFELAKQVALGAAAGFVEWSVSATAQKTCMVAGVQFEEIPDEDEATILLPSEYFDRSFKEAVFVAPVLEELIFRGIIQTAVGTAIAFCLPQFAAVSALGMRVTNLTAALFVGTGLGILHMSNYEKGGAAMASISAISGSFFGILKERLGLITSISAHIVHNFATTLIDKHYPNIFESPRENTIRLERERLELQRVSKERARS